ncbi:MAG: ThiF family adenylyltransferase, partial [Pseudomonadales bacterium]
DAIEWTRSLGGESDTDDDRLFGSEAASPPAIVVVGNNGVIGFAPVANALIKLAKSRKGFRATSVSRFWRTEADNLQLSKFHGHLSNHLELVSRSLNQLPPLAGKKIALIGCGTIGGYLARMLVQNGAGFSGALVLIDNQLFLPENVGRHILGIEFSGQPKSQSLAEYLNRDFPDAELEAITDNIQQCWGQFRGFDLVIDATGMEKVSSALNQHVRQIRQDGTYPPVL